MPKKGAILIVDDERNLRRTLGFILQRAGYSVSSAADGGEALIQLKAEPFDLVFVDLQLPDVEGIKLAQVIRNTFPQLPVIILTGHPTFETKTEAARQSIAAYLVKPIDPNQILKRVEDVLEHPKDQNYKKK